MAIPPRFKDEIRNRLQLSSIIGKKVRLTRAGREFKGCCPFHAEKTPSFYVNDDKQFYHCFGCGAHGDAIEFVMRHDNLSFIDAIEGLAAEAGLQIPKFDKAQVEKFEKEKNLYDLLEDAAKFFESTLTKNDDVMRYILDRNLTTETIRRFRIGFAPSDGEALRKFLKSKNYTDAQMIEAGVLRTSTKSKEPYAFFRDRVMFPVCDRRGRVIAFSGRILPDHMRPPDREGYKPGKYVNSPEGTLFDKGRTLYAENIARGAAREGKPIILAEGQMDVIACAQSGFDGAVAPMGTALTENQIVILWSMIPSEEKVPILCFDGDNAGRSAAARASERILPLLKPNQSARFAFMPEGEDPDSFLHANGPAAFQKILDASISLFDFLWSGAVQNRDLAIPEIRAGIVKHLNDKIATIADGEVQRHYKALVQEKISSFFFHRKERREIAQGSAPRRAMSPPALKPRAPTFGDIHMRALLAALINHPHIFNDIEEALGGLDFPSGRLGLLKNAINTALVDNPALDKRGLKTHLSKAGYEKEIDDICSESIYVHAGFAAPGADPALVLARWHALSEDIKIRQANAEGKTDWLNALSNGNAEDEERLRVLYELRLKNSA